MSMCGIFGMVRDVTDANPERATAVFVSLGRKSVSRGRDSAGYAAIPWERDSSTAEAGFAAINAKLITLPGGMFIAKDTTSFDNFWEEERDVPVVAAAAAVLGHTRAATQGSTGAKSNTSPMAVGSLVGTHNGDIDKSTVPFAGKRPMTFGSTDTEVLYRSVNSKNSHRKKIVGVLEKVQGRIALAWVDRRLPGRLNLARGGLSPLAVAWDAAGNFYWASSPEWFREIDREFDGLIGFRDISMVTEGHLLTVSFSTGKPEITDSRTFEPKVRFSDERLPRSIVYRGLSDSDQKADTENTRRVVIPAPVSSSTSRQKTQDSRRWGGSQPEFFFGSAECGSQRWGDYARDAREAEFDVYGMDGDFSDESSDRADVLDDMLDDMIAASSMTDFEAALEVMQELRATGPGNNEISPIVFESLREAIAQSNFDRVAEDYALPSPDAAELLAFLAMENEAFSFD